MAWDWGWDQVVSVAGRKVKRTYHMGLLVVGASVGVHCKACEEGEAWRGQNQNKGSTTTNSGDHATLRITWSDGLIH